MQRAFAWFETTFLPKVKLRIPNKYHTKESVMGYNLDQAFRELFHTENIISYTIREGADWIAAIQGCIPSHAYAIRTNIGRSWDRANGWREQAEKAEEPISGDLQLSVKDITDLCFESKVALNNVVQEVKKNRDAAKEKAKKDAEFEAFYSRVIQLMRDKDIVVDSGNPLVSGKGARTLLRESIKEAWYGQFR